MLASQGLQLASDVADIGVVRQYGVHDLHLGCLRVATAMARHFDAATPSGAYPADFDFSDSILDPSCFTKASGAIKLDLSLQNGHANSPFLGWD